VGWDIPGQSGTFLDANAEKSARFCDMQKAKLNCGDHSAAEPQPNKTDRTTDYTDKHGWEKKLSVQSV
jgi:hypothetical protein